MPRVPITPLTLPGGHRKSLFLLGDKMTTREIAEFCEVTVKTVRRWIAKASGEGYLSPEKLKMLEAGEKGTTVDWNDEETKRILTAGGKRFIADMMSRVGGHFGAVKNAPEGNGDRLDRLEAMVIQLVGAISAMVPAIAKEAPKAIAAPTLAPRDELRQIIANAARDSGDYSGTWNAFYQAIYYRLHINAKERAKNAGVAALDIIEAEGLLPEAIAIAREVF
jgi:hypothetical protein